MIILLFWQNLFLFNLNCLISHPKLIQFSVITFLPDTFILSTSVADSVVTISKSLPPSLNFGWTRTYFYTLSFISRLYSSVTFSSFELSVEYLNTETTVYFSCKCFFFQIFSAEDFSFYQPSMLFWIDLCSILINHSRLPFFCYASKKFLSTLLAMLSLNISMNDIKTAK